jgi:hypothetical protein
MNESGSISKSHSSFLSEMNKTPPPLERKATPIKIMEKETPKPSIDFTGIEKKEEREKAT